MHSAAQIVSHPLVGQRKLNLPFCSCSIFSIMSKVGTTAACGPTSCNSAPTLVTSRTAPPSRMGRRPVVLALLALLVTWSLLQLLCQLGGSLLRRNTSQPVYPDGTRHRRAHSQVLLWTQIRSGSSFTGRVLSLGTRTFYSEEPIRVHNHALGRDVGAAAAFLKDILLCRFSRHLEYFKDYITWHFQDLKVKYLCEFEPRLCSSPFTYEAFCRAAPVVVVRVVALALRAFIPLLEDDELDPKVVHLVRDPRGALSSRRSLPSYAHLYEEESNVSAVCERYREDLAAAATLRQRFPER